MSDKITNAVIKKCCLFQEYGTLRLTLCLEHSDGSSQDFGCYQIAGGHPSDDKDCGKYLLAIMRVCGVTQWDDVDGSVIRCRRGVNRGIEAIGHIVRDDWFCPKMDFGGEA